MILPASCSQEAAFRGDLCSEKKNSVTEAVVFKLELLIVGSR